MSKQGALIFGASTIAVMLFIVACAVFAPRMTPADKKVLTRLENVGEDFALACYHEWESANLERDTNQPHQKAVEDEEALSPTEAALAERDLFRSQLSWHDQDQDFDKACGRSWMRWAPMSSRRSTKSYTKRGCSRRRACIGEVSWTV